MLLRLLSPAGPGARLSVLILHRVLSRPDPMLPGEVDAARFDSVCGWLRRSFNVLPLDEAVGLLREGRLPQRAAGLTFDDGYADNHDVALPVLRRHGITATFFVATGYLDGGSMFNDVVRELVRDAPGTTLDLRHTVLGDLGVHDIASVDARRALVAALLPPLKLAPKGVRDEFCAQLRHAVRLTAMPSSLMMSSAQVVALHRAGMQIGAHTVGHPILRTLDDATALREISGSRDTLQSLIGARVGLFAYPNGRPDDDYTQRTAALVRQAGFDAAFTTAWGAASRDSDLFQLPRFTPWDRTAWRFGIRMEANLLLRRHERVAGATSRRRAAPRRGL